MQQLGEYKFLKVSFESEVDWCQTEDYLHCDPTFHGQPRYDCVLVDANPKPFFAQLLYTFACNIENVTYGFALISPFNYYSSPCCEKDRDFQFLRLQASPANYSIFIALHSIIRGALIMPDSEKSGDFLVIKEVDSDMFLRIQELETKIR
jgi:hypothetical protein